METQGVKISQMSELTEINGTEYIPVVRDNANFKVNIENVKHPLKTKFIDLNTLANASSNEEITAILGTVSQFLSEIDNTLYYVRDFNQYSVLPLNVRYDNGLSILLQIFFTGGSMVVLDLFVSVFEDNWEEVQYNQYSLQLNKL